jgi:beta-barrel assembly-enhancing protease
MEDVKGFWYDGQSSMPVEVLLRISINDNRLYIKSEGQEGGWSFDNLSLQIIGSSVHIYNKSIPGQTIHTENLVFGKVLLRYSRLDAEGWYNRMLHAGTKVHVAIAAVIIGFIAVMYFLVLPWAAEQAVVLIPESFDKSLGDNVYGNYIQYETIDSSLTKLVQSFADEMDFNMTAKPDITVVKSDIKNAFALPGGHIVVFTPILESMNDYSELAALLSHESAHIKNRHSVKMMCRNLSGYLLISALFSDVNGLMAVITDNMNQLTMLSYSRGYEKEADLNGWAVLRENKINPQGMIDLFNHLKVDKNSDRNEENNAYEIPEFLSTHPLTDQRIKDISQIIKREPYQFKSDTKLKFFFTGIHSVVNAEN